jgi:hypothetical protein
MAVDKRNHVEDALLWDTFLKRIMANFTNKVNKGEC